MKRLPIHGLRRDARSLAAASRRCRGGFEGGSTLWIRHVREGDQERPKSAMILAMRQSAKGGKGPLPLFAYSLEGSNDGRQRSTYLAVPSSLRSHRFPVFCSAVVRCSLCFRLVVVTTKRTRLKQTGDGARWRRNDSGRHDLGWRLRDGQHCDMCRAPRGGLYSPILQRDLPGHRGRTATSATGSTRLHEVAHAHHNRRSLRANLA